jgi:hypothetical protein
MYSSEPYSSAPSPVQISQRFRVTLPAALVALATVGLTLLVLVLALGIGSNSGSLPQHRDTPPPAPKVSTTIEHPAATTAAQLEHYLADGRFLKLGR